MSNKNKNILLGVLIVGVISMSVAFAALSTRLNIGGTANVAATKWNIHFQNWALDTQSTVTVGSNTQQNTAEYPTVAQLTMSDNTNVTKVEGINVTLKQPNDYVKYTFEIKNDGTIDGELDNFTKTITPTNDVINYTITCTDTNSNDALQVGYILEKDKSVSCELKVEYKDQTNINTAGSNQIYEQSEINTTISAEWTWVQGSSSSSSEGETPVLTSWDKYYTRKSPDGSDSLDDDANVWVQYNTSSGTKEVCGKLESNTTICVNKDKIDYDNSVSENIILDGTKTQALVKEFEDSGATCRFSGSRLQCSDSKVFLNAWGAGDVEFDEQDDGNGCGIFNPNSTISCSSY